MSRVELNEQNLEDVIGGAYHFYYDEAGVKCCKVDGIGIFKCTAEAQDKLYYFKLMHKGEGLKAADYVQMMLECGCFFN